MCLIVVGWRVHPDYPLVVAANRDEFHARPSAVAGYWPDTAEIIGGRDLEAGGTWMGMTVTGRFAAITNVREPGMAKGSVSRGALTSEFLRCDSAAIEYARQIDGARYSGFNLLLSDGETLTYASNRDGEPRTLASGIYGLSNHLLDTPWPKLIKARQAFANATQHLPDETGFFDLLADRALAPDDLLPKTGVSLDWERLLSAVFVQSATYGTRCSTLAWVSKEGSVQMHERSFAPDGSPIQSSLISTSE